MQYFPTDSGQKMEYIPTDDGQKMQYFPTDEGQKMQYFPSDFCNPQVTLAIMELKRLDDIKMK